MDWCLDVNGGYVDALTKLGLSVEVNEVVRLVLVDGALADIRRYIVPFCYMGVLHSGYGICKIY